MKIFLNPGHDRQLDSGAVNPVHRLREADVVWSVTEEVTRCIRERLNDAGIETETLQDDSLSRITNVANNSGSDYFVSIHCNAFNTVAQGTEVEVYSHSSAGNELAKAVQSSIVETLSTVDRGVKERPGLYVLKYTEMPAILVELAFIDNEEDYQLLANRPEAFAAAVANGILKYLGIGTTKPGLDAAVNTANHNLVAPNGVPYDQNDIDYLLKNGYDLTSALSFLDTTDKYSNSDMKNAAAYAESRVGTTGYGNNGCTEWVRQFLLKANHWFGKLMTDGSQGNLMWVPNIMEYAKANGLWKNPEQGGNLGDICLLETNYCTSDGPDHVVIATGDGSYWGNSSSRNKIVKSSIADDYGASNVWGYVATGTSGKGYVAEGDSNRTPAEIVGDAGSTSYVNLAPNGAVYEENDIKYLTNQGYTIEQAIDILSKDDKYTKAEYIAPNGKLYSNNDIDYLLKQGYTKDAALAFLSTADKYMI